MIKGNSDKVDEVLEILKTEDVVSCLTLPTKQTQEFQKKLLTKLKTFDFSPLVLDCRLCPWVSVENFLKLILSHLSLPCNISVPSQEVELAVQVQNQLGKLLQKKEIVLIIRHLWPFFIFGSTIPLFLTSLLEKFKGKLKIIFFFENNLQNPRLKKKLRGSHLIFQNIVLIPPQKITKPEAEVIFDNLEPSEKSYLRLVAHNCFSSSSHQDYFLKMGLIRRRGKKFLITNPYLAALALKVPPSKENSLILKGDKIYLNNEEITQVFSPTEQKILKSLIKSSTKFLSREKIAKIIWEDQWLNSYSEWAIDKTISRLRKKFQKIWLGEAIKTLKKRGIKLNLS